MRSFNFSKELDNVMLFNIYSEILKSKGYFHMFCGQSADEAMQLAMIHALTHYRENKGDLGAYVRSLARTILRDRYANTVTPVDFLEETVKLDSESADFANQVVDKIVEEECYEKVVRLALSDMNYFVMLCNAIESKNYISSYFPDHFIDSCLKLQNEYTSFFSCCMNLYNKYKEEFNWFIKDESNPSWVEANFVLIRTRSNSKVEILNKRTNKVSKDPDIEDCVVKGLGSGKHIISISYARQLTNMCNLIDEEGINKMRFSIGDEYIVRTLGGSVSMLSPSLFNMYSLCEAEILTNLLRETNGKFICKGSERMYFLVGEIPKLDTKIVRGTYLTFSVKVEM